MADESVTAETAQARLAGEIKRLRGAADLSQSGLGERVGYTRNYVSMAERAGGNLPSQNLVEALDQALGAAGWLCALWREAKEEQQVRRRTGRVTVLTSSSEGVEDAELSRQAAAEDARDAARTARMIASSGTTNEAVEQFDSEIRRIAAAYISRPLVDVFGEIRELRHEVFRLLDSNRIPNQLRDLYLHASRLGGLQAHVALDLGDYRAADVHAQTAWLYAKLAGHQDMLGWIKALQSLIAYWDDRLEDAVERAREGALFRPRGTTGARLASLEARACAARGDEQGTLTALDVADTARADATMDEYSGVFTFPAAKQSVYAGTTLLTLKGSPALAKQAIGKSQFALDVYQAAAPADRSAGDIFAARLDLAGAHMVLGDLDATQSFLVPVLAAPQVRRTASIVKRARDIGDRLSSTKYLTTARAKGLRNEIREFCAPPPALPPGATVVTK
ncbi:helix-turn-helix domain-containing protein [Amycolatopsis roodepoortensis]|uniref:Transcriptional regulator with XRE-family HTH domain n=1 Tax=Amycolatopsis roodepoortensis TaxID=700274 RepID=A0ABR9L5N0_9PSEU|nr:helix-turn-helix transcriptional regulator [Amycolatopsis roodepoortensis]MBE1575443.1 transcriptional regulator with XRE-family HTH domain [Amycolatopsis roodepoortensis]